MTKEARDVVKGKEGRGEKKAEDGAIRKEGGRSRERKKEKA